MSYSLFAIGHINKPGKIAPVHKRLVQIRYLRLDSRLEGGSYDKRRLATDATPMDLRTVLVLTLAVVFVFLFLLDKSSKVDGGEELEKLREVGAKADVMRVLRKLQASQVFVFQGKG